MEPGHGPEETEIIMKKTISLFIAAGLVSLGVAHCGKKKEGGLDPKEVAKGKALFEGQKYNCVSCHGKDGKGQTPTGKALKARDFTKGNFKNGDSVKALANTILNGGTKAKLNAAMVAFKNQGMTQAEATSLATYVKSFKK